MKKLFKFILFIICAFVSSKFCTDDWVVGPVFGMTALLWQTDLKISINLKNLLFVAASTLIYFAVRKIDGLWEIKNQWLEFFFGSFGAAVIFGSIAMPLAHQAIFPQVKTSVRKVIIALIISYYLIYLISYIFTEWLKAGHVNFLAVMVVVWQALYLYVFDRNASSEHESNR